MKSGEVRDVWVARGAIAVSVELRLKVVLQKLVVISCKQDSDAMHTLLS